MVVRMIARGEESGSLEKMLKNVSELYDTHVDTKISGLSTIIEPARWCNLYTQSNRKW